MAAGAGFLERIHQLHSNNTNFQSTSRGPRLEDGRDEATAVDIRHVATAENVLK